MKWSHGIGEEKVRRVLMKDILGGLRVLIK